jgi:dihydrodipicolinate synthase/N-acetylneuraminate lyase
MTWREHPWAGVFPATLCAFHDDESIDEEGLRGPISRTSPATTNTCCRPSSKPATAH